MVIFIQEFFFITNKSFWCDATRCSRNTDIVEENLNQSSFSSVSLTYVSYENKTCFSAFVNEDCVESLTFCWEGEMRLNSLRFNFKAE